MAKTGLVAADIDGTLIINWDPRGIDPRVFEQIRELKGRGVRFAAASGRQYLTLRRFFAPVADDIFYVCENGSVIMGDGPAETARTIACTAMERDLAMEVCRAVMEYPGIELMVNAPRAAWVPAARTDFIAYLYEILGMVPKTFDDPEDIDDDIVKACFWAPEELMGEASAHFTERFGERLKVVTSGTMWFDIMPLGVDKASGLRSLGEALGIEPAAMMAFGDEKNDIEMLDLVGAPYLMESGNEELRGLNDRIRLCASVDGKLDELLAAPGVF